MILTYRKYSCITLEVEKYTKNAIINNQFSVTSIDDRGYIYLTDMVGNIGNGSALIEKRLVSKIQ